MKKIVLVILVIVMLLTICSCGKMVECDFCGNEVKEKTAYTNDVWGETMYMCQECYDELKELFE